jgi:hypothetical protein
MSNSKLKELLERVEKATGPDRDIDFDLAELLDEFAFVPTFGMAGNWYKRPVQYGLTTDVPAYTASIDAAVALVGKVLPGWSWVVGRNDTDSEHMCIMGDSPQNEFESEGSSPPLAILAAMLRALIAINAHKD